MQIRRGVEQNYKESRPGLDNHQEHNAIIKQGSLTEDNVSSPIVAEALALRLGIIDAVKLEINRIKIFSDNLTLIRVINFETQAKELFGIIRDIHRISSVFIEISFHHISRNLICDVDQIAKQTLLSFAM